MPTSEEIDAERSRHGRPLVVVNGGAGGDQVHDGYGHRLLHACRRTASRLHTEGHPARFVVVTGPYYAGPPLTPLPNLTVHRFTATLPALLAAADVAVVKPGNNALAEALHGQAHLVLVPDASYLEGTLDHAHRVAHRYGGTVTDPEHIEHAVRAALARHAPRTRRPPHPQDAVLAAVDAISRCATPPEPALPPRPVCLLGQPPAADLSLPPGITAALSLSTVPASGPPPPWLVADGPPGRSTPQDLVDRGVKLLIASDALPASVARWLHLSPPRPALLTATAERVTIRSHDSPDHPVHALARALAEPTRIAVLLDLRRLGQERAVTALGTISTWLARQPVANTPPERLRSDAATRLLHGNQP